MNSEYFWLLLGVFTIVFFAIQRTEGRSRLIVILTLGITGGIFLRNFIVFRQIEREAWMAIALALVLNFLFWLLIGRYNPVRSSDEIQVLGMDD